MLARRKYRLFRIWWVYLNADVSLWSDGFSDATCLAYFSIGYSGDDIAPSDIAYARCHKPNSEKYWSFTINSASVDTTNKVIRGPWFYTTDLSANGSAFPIGNMIFEVGLNSGYAVEYDFDIPAPGQLVSGGYEVAYNEDYLGEKLPNYVPMLKRASITSYGKDGTSIAINFKLDDPLFYSGNVTFYDVAGNQVGHTGYMRTYGTGTIAPFVNNGASLHKDGTENKIVLTSAYIDFVYGKAYSDIARFRIFASDGFQYLGTSHTYDCYSAGELTAF